MSKFQNHDVLYPTLVKCPGKPPPGTKSHVVAHEPQILRASSV